MLCYHGNNCYENVSQYKVVSTMSILLNLYLSSKYLYLLIP